jgi:hypothetical protein
LRDVVLLSCFHSFGVICGAYIHCSENTTTILSWLADRRRDHITFCDFREYFGKLGSHAMGKRSDRCGDCNLRDDVFWNMDCKIFAAGRKAEMSILDILKEIGVEHLKNFQLCR